MGKSLRVACVGAGYFSRFHYESWQRIPSVSLVGACDLDLEKAQATGVAPFDDLAEMLAATEPDLLDIILPPSAQSAAFEAALDGGVQHVICQKPFGQSIDSARDMVARAEAAGVTLIVHENFRFQPWYRAVKAALMAGRIGSLSQMTFRFRPGDGNGPDAYLDRQPYFQTMERFLVHETAVHWIDTFRFIAGEPNAVYADLRTVNPAIAGEDAGFVLFDFENGVRAIFDGNRCLDHGAANSRHTMGEGLFEGTDGTVAFGGDGAVMLRMHGQTRQESLLPAFVSAGGFGGDCVHHLQNHVANALCKGAPIENLARDYLHVLEIEQAIYASAETGRKIKL